MKVSNCATYRICNYYLYTPNYSKPDEAAKRFKAMLNSPLPGGLAEKFIRINLDAELTSGHHSHLDASYRYSINDDKIKVEKIEFLLQHFEKCKIIFEGPLALFIEEQENSLCETH